MTIKDILHETYIALAANKIRSSLTMLGIIIGISSVIAMLAVGQGAQNSIQSSIQSIGSNLIIVYPGAQRGPGTAVSAGRGSARTLKLTDATAIKNQIDSSLIKAVAPDVTGRYQIAAKGQNTNTSVTGTVPDYELARNIEVTDGSFISDQNNTALNKVAVLGPTTRDDLFGVDTDASEVIGQTIRINKIEFKVIGITKAKGGSGFNNPDDVIYIPIATAQRYLSGNEYLSTISIAATDAEAASMLQQSVSDLLLQLHNIKDATLADFNILNQADIIATASSITQTFTILLGSVAGISLIVGGIGIMNMMLTSVTERTREIGLRKAVGAKRRDINVQFLAEAIALTFVGGMIGVILGWAISFVIAYLGILQSSVSLFSVILAFSVSAAIGVIFGYYPARRAAMLSPIDALRYE